MLCVASSPRTACFVFEVVYCGDIVSGEHSGHEVWRLHAAAMPNALVRVTNQGIEQRVDFYLLIIIRCEPQTPLAVVYFRIYIPSVRLELILAMPF